MTCKIFPLIISILLFSSCSFNKEEGVDNCIEESSLKVIDSLANIGTLKSFLYGKKSGRKAYSPLLNSLENIGFDKAISCVPDTLKYFIAEAYFLRGDSLFENNHIKKSNEDFKKALEMLTLEPFSKTLILSDSLPQEKIVELKENKQLKKIDDSFVRVSYPKQKLKLYEAYIHNYLGITYEDLFNLELAENHAETAISILNPMVGNDLELKAMLAQFIGNKAVIKQTILQYDESIRLHNESLDLKKTILDSIPQLYDLYPEVIHSYIGLSQAYLKKYHQEGTKKTEDIDLKKAEDYGIEAIKQFELMKMLKRNNKEEKADVLIASYQVYRNMSEVYITKSNNELALENINKAILTSKESDGIVFEDKDFLTVQKAHIYSKMSKTTKAIQLIEPIISEIEEGIKNKNGIGKNDNIIQSIDIASDIWWKHFQKYSDDVALEKSLALSKLNIEYLEFLKQVLSEQEIQIIIENFKFLYEKTIKQLIVLGENKIPIIYPDPIQWNTFKIANKTKNYLFKKELNKKRVREKIVTSLKLNDILDTIDQKRDLLYAKKASLMGMKKDTSQAKNIINIEVTISKIQRDIDSLSNMLFESDPELFQLLNSVAPSSIDSIQSNLDDSTAIIDYYLFSKNTTFAFVITQSSIQIYQLDGFKKWQQDLTTYRNALTIDPNKGSIKIDSFKTSSNRLYKMLVKDILGRLPVSVNKLHIIPDKEIWLVKFETLLRKKSDSKDYDNLPYLMWDYAVSYNYTTDIYTDKLQHSSSQLSFGGFACQYKGEASSVRVCSEADLPNSRKEISELSNINEWKSLQIDTIATKNSFQNNYQKFDILHLSMHGCIESNPLETHLKFGDNDTLTIADIYGLKFKNTKMAVLSACNTNSVDVERGKGVFSIAQAFAYRGCNSLIACNWEAQDLKGKDIMVSIYNGLKSGLRKDVAIQNAYKHYLNRPKHKITHDYRHPYYWAYFEVIGDYSPIF